MNDVMVNGCGVSHCAAYYLSALYVLCTKNVNLVIGIL